MSAYSGSSVVQNDTSETAHPCRNGLPCSMLHAWSMFDDASEVTEIVEAFATYSAKNPSTTTVMPTAANHRLRAQE